MDTEQTRDFIIGGESFTANVPVPKDPVREAWRQGPTFKDGAVDYDEWKERLTAVLDEGMCAALVSDGPERWKKLRAAGAIPNRNAEAAWDYLTGRNRERRRYLTGGWNRRRKMTVPKGK